MDATLLFRGRAKGATGRFAGDFFWNKNTPSLMATKINKNLENSFVFAPNEMQQVAFEGAKQNEILRTTMRIN